jgi:U3 small nucleolar RNA-associated protein 20
LKYALDTLIHTLTRGSQLHVLGYTLHSLLVHLSSQKSPDEKIEVEEGIEKEAKREERRRKERLFGSGSMDNCIGDIMGIIMNEIFGEVAEKKEVKKIQIKMKETGPSKALHSLEILSSVVSFPQVLSFSIRPICL